MVWRLVDEELCSYQTNNSVPDNTLAKTPELPMEELGIVQSNIYILICFKNLSISTNNIFISLT